MMSSVFHGFPPRDEKVNATRALDKRARVIVVHANDLANDVGKGLVVLGCPELVLGLSVSRLDFDDLGVTGPAFTSHQGRRSRGVGGNLQEGNTVAIEFFPSLECSNFGA